MNAQQSADGYVHRLHFGKFKPPGNATDTSAIHFTPVSDTQDADNFFFFVEFVDNPVCSDPNTLIMFRS
jgi:hypothetical protein